MADQQGNLKPVTPARVAEELRKLSSQRANGGRWNPLGTYTFRHRGWAKVLMSRSLSTPDGTIAADAIRVTYLNRPPVAQMALPASAAHENPSAGPSACWSGSHQP